MIKFERLWIIQHKEIFYQLFSFQTIKLKLFEENKICF